MLGRTVCERLRDALERAFVKVVPFGPAVSDKARCRSFIAGVSVGRVHDRLVQQGFMGVPAQPIFGSARAHLAAVGLGPADVSGSSDSLAISVQKEASKVAELNSKLTYTP